MQRNALMPLLFLVTAPFLLFSEDGDHECIANIPKRLSSTTDPAPVLILEGHAEAILSEDLILKDSSGATLIHLLPQVGRGFQEGDLLRVSCVASKHPISPYWLNATNVIRLARGQKPETPLMTLPEIADGQAVCRKIRSRGVITDVFQDEIDPMWIYLILEGDGSSVVMTTRNRETKTMSETESFIDCAVEVTGVGNPTDVSKRMYLGPTILFDRLEDIRRIDEADISSAKGLHRKTFAGRVIATWEGKSFFLRTDDGSRIRVHLMRGQQPPRESSRVTISGFLTHNIFFAELSNALVLLQEPSDDAGDDPIALSVRDILYDPLGRPMIHPEYDGRLVTVEGRIFDILRPGAPDGKLLLASDGELISVTTGRIPVPDRGSRIALTGACLMTFDQTRHRMMHANGFALVIRRASDIRVLAPPPWWTPGRFLCVIGALLAVLAGIFAWNRVLQRLVERRGRQLLRAQIEGERSSLRIGERTRLAVELHDSLSQNLTGVGFQLDSFRCARDSDAAAAERHLETAERILSSCRTELRRCLWDLRSDALEEPDFALAIRKVLQPFMDKADVIVRFNVPRTRLNDSIAHAILRIIRELTANAIVHGKAGCVRVAGSFEDGSVLFSVTDDGCGFDPSACPGPADGHFGIVGIRERITELQGTFDLSASRTSGTRIRIRLPVTQKQPPDMTPS